MFKLTQSEIIIYIVTRKDTKGISMVYWLTSYIHQRWNEISFCSLELKCHSEELPVPLVSISSMSSSVFMIKINKHVLRLFTYLYVLVISRRILHKPHSLLLIPYIRYQHGWVSYINTPWLWGMCYMTIMLLSICIRKHRTNPCRTPTVRLVFYCDPAVCWDPPPSWQNYTWCLGQQWQRGTWIYILESYRGECRTVKIFPVNSFLSCERK